jgi:hypothetical protein
MLEEMHASGGESWEELVRLAVGLYPTAFNQTA